MSLKLFCFKICTLGLLAGLLSACSHNQPETNYGIVVYDSIQDANRFIPASSLSSGNPEAKGPNLPGGLLITSKNNDFYFMELPSRTLIHYKAGADGLKEVKKLPMSGIPFEAYSTWVVWTGPNTILLGSTENKNFFYSEINLASMMIQRRGSLDMPSRPSPDLSYPSLAVAFVRQQLFIFYTFQKGYMREHINPPDGTVYTAVFNYPNLQRVKTFSDSRTTWPGSYNIWSPNHMVDQDTIYVLGHPGGRTALHPVRRPAVLRVVPGADGFDQEYFFDLGTNADEEVYTMQQVTSNLALTKIVNKGLVKRFDDYIQKKTAQYELLDLKQKKRIKIPLPAIELDFFKDAIVEGDLIFLPFYLNNGKTKFWIYNIKTGKVNPGAEITGRILRAEKISAD